MYKINITRKIVLLTKTEINGTLSAHVF